MIMLTPINLTTKNPSKKTTQVARQDYKREETHFVKGATGFNPKWDDSAHNNAQVGDAFGFVHNITDRIEYFEIIAIIPAEDRPDYWDLPEHQRRRVLILSHKIKEEKFSLYKERVGYKPNYIVRGTVRGKWVE